MEVYAERWDMGNQIKRVSLRSKLSSMEKLTAFVSEHIGDDTTRLIMNKTKWPEIDMDLAVNCIESRRKLNSKVQEWCDEPGLIFPRKLSAEQCSSSATGIYKAELAEHIYNGDNANNSTSCPSGGFRLADLTGGLGVDSWFFSKKAAQVMYCEMLPELCKAAQHNYKILGSGNITVKNAAVISETQISQAESDNVQCLNAEGRPVFQTPAQILTDFHPDIVYMDPARRGEGGKKVFLIEDCTPDVLTLKNEIFQHTRHILLKLSPMADITMVCERLGKCCREVHVVATGGECKELLVWMDSEWNQEYTIHAVELHKSGETGIFSFTAVQERMASAPMYKTVIANEGDASCHMQNRHIYLFEPGKALMKAGAFNLIAERFQIAKLGQSTHYYIFSDLDGERSYKSDSEAKRQSMFNILKSHGKLFRIIRMEQLDKRTIKAAGKEFPKAEVTARNIPMDTDTLRKKLGVTSGDYAHIFGLKADSAGMLLVICSILK